MVAVIRNSEMVKKNVPFKKTDIYLDLIGVLYVDYIKQHSCTQISEFVREIISDTLQEKLTFYLSIDKIING